MKPKARLYSPKVDPKTEHEIVEVDPKQVETVAGKLSTRTLPSGLE